MDFGAKRNPVKTMVSLALFIALSVVLTRYLSIATPTLRIGFGSIPVMLSGMFFGPLAGAITGAVSDLIGYMLNPMGGSYFPGFTISAAIRGALFGFVFMTMKSKGRKVNFNIVSAVVVSMLAVGIVLISNRSQEMNFNSWPIVAKGFFALTTVAFMIIPVFISKYWNKSTFELEYSLEKVLFAMTLTYILVSIGLNTLWLSMLIGKSFIVLLPSRVITGLFVVPIHAVIIYVLSNSMKKIM